MRQGAPMRTVAIGLVALWMACRAYAANEQIPFRLSNAAACSALVGAFPPEALRSDETVPGAKPWCDEASDPKSPYAVIGLHSSRRCDYICSSLVGWFAVERTTGRIYVWEVAEMSVGRLVWDGKGCQVDTDSRSIHDGLLLLD
jgi:hypothetical protein